MIKKLFFVVKKVIMACILIYAYDSLTLPLDVMIPINFFTVLLVSVFGVPAMFGLVLFNFLF